MKNFSFLFKTRKENVLCLGIQKDSQIGVTLASINQAIVMYSKTVPLPQHNQKYLNQISKIAIGFLPCSNTVATLNRGSTITSFIFTLPSWLMNCVTRFLWLLCFVTCWHWLPVLSNHHQKVKFTTYLSSSKGYHFDFLKRQVLL